MNKVLCKLISALLTAAILCMCSLSASADELRAGSVKGLPEKLVVLDDRGNSVSENGDYYFSVEGMKEGEHYTKKVQIMNLREDATYHIDFMAQKISSSGTIDLENDCHCIITLQNEKIYEGKVTGEGTPDIRTKPLDLGSYGPGQSRTMNIDIVWIDSGSGGAIDNGARIVDQNGTTIVREASGINHVEGEVIFKWIFTAVVDLDNPSNPSDHPDTPVKTGETITFIAFGVATLAMAVMLILVLAKRKKHEKNKQQ